MELKDSCGPKMGESSFRFLSSEDSGLDLQDT